MIAVGWLAALSCICGAVGIGVGLAKAYGPGYTEQDLARMHLETLPFEAEFIAQHVRDGQQDTGFLLRKRPAQKAEIPIFYRFWLPKHHQLRGVIVVLHGLTSHTGAANQFCLPLLAQGFVVAGMDHEGHGRSGGRHGFFNDFDSLVEDALAFIELTQSRFRDQKLLLLGGSLGGMLVLHVLSRLKGQVVAGAAVLAPAFMIDPDTRPPFILEMIAKSLRGIAPKLPIVLVDPDKNNSPQVAKQVQAKLKSDPLYYGGNLPIGTALAILDGMNSIQCRNALAAITIPLLILHGTNDKVVPLKGSQIILDCVHSKDKTLKRYQNAYHDLSNEPSAIREAVIKDLVEWFLAHTH